MWLGDGSARRGGTSRIKRRSLTAHLLVLKLQSVRRAGLESFELKQQPDSIKSYKHVEKEISREIFETYCASLFVSSLFIYDSPHEAI